jgi:hypothetical protein
MGGEHHVAEEPMRFGYTSTLFLFSAAGLAWILGAGCAGKDTGSTFTSGGNAGPGTGTGSLAGGAAGGLLTTGGSTMTGIISTGTTGAGGSGGLDPDASCGTTRQNTKAVPVDVLILQDKSGSMTCPAADDNCTSGNGTPSRWDAMGMALGTFVDSPAPAMAGVAIGLTFFGLQNGSVPCTANSYQTPVVAIMPLPGNATPIKSAIAATMPGGGTPTAPALQGAIAYARQYTAATAGQRTAAVLLVTDGNPTMCGQTNVTQTVAAATAGFTGTPSIKTFVVGMGNTAALQEVAVAGGTMNYIPTNGDVVGTLTNALSAITTQVTCSYPIPAGSNPLLVNVEITLGMGGMPIQVGKVDNAAACGTQGGWYYDVNPPGKPTTINLCPQSCDPVKATMDSSVQVVYGCPSVGPK